MKRIFYLLLALTYILPTACQNSPQKEAQKTADAINEVMETNGPPKVSTSNNGYTMKAIIDGKPWTASKMMEINPSNKEFVHGSNGEIKIGFYIDRDFVKVGKSHKLGEGHSADLDLGGDNLMSAKKGEYTITKADDKMIEGTFHFTAGAFQSDEKREVTDGFFRILLKQ